MTFLSDRPLTRARAITCAVTNQFVTPGLGSLMGKRWIAGCGQIILSSASCVLILVWFFKILIQYYGQISGDVKPHPVGWIGVWGAILFVVSWLWSAITSFSLLREAAKVNLKSIEKSAAPPVQKSDAARVVLALGKLPEWKRNGDMIARTFEFKDFPAAMDFTNAVAALAEQAQHHPDIDVRWNKVTLALTTHDAGGLTEKDFALARQCDALALR
jgi:4a-hydroxytetrahydrobiopterin dehydratase